jgi:hypothetical protein
MDRLADPHRDLRVEPFGDRQLGPAAELNHPDALAAL